MKESYGEDLAHQEIDWRISTTAKSAAAIGATAIPVSNWDRALMKPLPVGKRSIFPAKARTVAADGWIFLEGMWIEGNS